MIIIDLCYLNPGKENMVNVEMGNSLNKVYWL